MFGCASGGAIKVVIRRQVPPYPQPHQLYTVTTQCSEPLGTALSTGQCTAQCTVQCQCTVTVQYSTVLYFDLYYAHHCTVGSWRCFCEVISSDKRAGGVEGTLHMSTGCDSWVIIIIQSVTVAHQGPSIKEGRPSLHKNQMGQAPLITDPPPISFTTCTRKKKNDM